MENWYALLENDTDVIGIFPSRLIANMTGKVLMKADFLEDTAFSVPVTLESDGSFFFDMTNKVKVVIR